VRRAESAPDRGPGRGAGPEPLWARPAPADELAADRALDDEARAEYCAAVRAFLLRTRGVRSRYGDRPLPVWDGGETADGRRHTAVWPKVAGFVRRHGLDLGRLVRCVFAARAVGTAGGAALGPPPPPTMLYSAEALRLYRADADRRHDADRESARAELCSQAEAFRAALVLRSALRAAGWSAEEVARSVVGDEALPLSALFRFCVAAQEGYQDLADRYFRPALRQYTAGRALCDDVWGERLPAALVAAAHSPSPWPRRGRRHG
jgi:hypothetical protein